MPSCHRGDPVEDRLAGTYDRSVHSMGRFHRGEPDGNLGQRLHHSLPATDTPSREALREGSGGRFDSPPAPSIRRCTDSHGHV